jgi:hypothetical protein
VNRRVFLIAMICAGLAAVAALFVSSRSAADPEGDPAAEAALADAPSPASAPEPPSPAGAPRAARTPAARPVEAEPEPSDEAPELGTLRIESDVPGAQVFIDRRFVGTTPLTAADVTPGTHQLNVTAEGFDGIAQSIDVEPGPRDLIFRFRDVRLDATLAVIHKHRMGSCRGQLVATAEGIRYETSDTDDGFSAALDDLETFQVDYQDKNLRIKLRKGRQFNFTDPDGNADRLFVFHRDVEKVRVKVGR